MGNFDEEGMSGSEITEKRYQERIVAEVRMTGSPPIGASMSAIHQAKLSNPFVMRDVNLDGSVGENTSRPAHDSVTRSYRFSGDAPSAGGWKDRAALLLLSSPVIAFVVFEIATFVLSASVSVWNGLKNIKEDIAVMMSTPSHPYTPEPYDGYKSEVPEKLRAGVTQKLTEAVLGFTATKRSIATTKSIVDQYKTAAEALKAIARTKPQYKADSETLEIMHDPQRSLMLTWISPTKKQAIYFHTVEQMKSAQQKVREAREIIARMNVDYMTLERPSETLPGKVAIKFVAVKRANVVEPVNAFRLTISACVSDSNKLTAICPDAVQQSVLLITDQKGRVYPFKETSEKTIEPLFKDVGEEGAILPDYFTVPHDSELLQKAKQASPQTPASQKSSSLNWKDMKPVAIVASLPTPQGCSVKSGRQFNCG